MREVDESPNDRNDRGKLRSRKDYEAKVLTVPSSFIGIRKSAAWYTQHIAQAHSSRSHPSIVLLTDDAENRRRAQAEDVKSISGILPHFPLKCN